MYDFDSSLEKCFAIERKLHANNFCKGESQISEIEDEFLKYSMLMLYVCNLFLVKQPVGKM